MSTPAAATPRRVVPAMSSGQVTRTVLLVALISMVVGGMAFQLGAADTSFDRPGEVVLLFVDIAPLLWFAAAPIILTTLRWQAMDARFRWVVTASVIAAAVAVAVRLLVLGDSALMALIDPYTAAFPLWIVAAVLFIRTRARRFAAGTDEGITLVGMALGFAVAAAGVALGGLRLVLVGPMATPGVPVFPVSEFPSVTFLTAATLAMVAGLFWLVDHTRRPRR
ncbi:MAG: hypothetical protein ACXIUP_00810 [Microcella sp.]